MTMLTLIYVNMAWNTAFVLMGLSEMLGLTSVHQALPWYFKWVWLIALAGGNLIIHFMMIRNVGLT